MVQLGARVVVPGGVGHLVEVVAVVPPPVMDAHPGHLGIGVLVWAVGPLAHYMLPPTRLLTTSGLMYLVCLIRQSAPPQCAVQALLGGGLETCHFSVVTRMVPACWPPPGPPR